MARERQKKRRFAARDQTLKRPLLCAIFFFCGLEISGYSIPRGGSTAEVSGRTCEIYGLCDCQKMQLENHQQLVIKKKEGN